MWCRGIPHCVHGALERAVVGSFAGSDEKSVGWKRLAPINFRVIDTVLLPCNLSGRLVGRTSRVNRIDQLGGRVRESEANDLRQAVTGQMSIRIYPLWGFQKATLGVGLGASGGRIAGSSGSEAISMGAGADSPGVCAAALTVGVAHRIRSVLVDRADHRLDRD